MEPSLKQHTRSQKKMLTDIKEWEIMYCIISDHSGIKLQKIAKEATKATQTLWRTNNALLNELGHG